MLVRFRHAGVSLVSNYIFKVVDYFEVFKRILHFPWLKECVIFLGCFNNFFGLIFFQELQYISAINDIVFISFNIKISDIGFDCFQVCKSFIPGYFIQLVDGNFG